MKMSLAKTPPRPGWTLAAASVATALMLLDVTVVYLALPAIAADLDASFPAQQWVIDAYALAVAAALLPAGAAADRGGRLRVFTAGLVAFAAASALCAVAPSSTFLNLARALQGLSAAAVLSAALALIAGAYVGDRRPVALAVWGAVSGAALAVGPVVGGLLVDGPGWRWVFAVNVPVALGLAALAHRRAIDTRDPGAPPPDMLGALLFAAALGCGVAGLLRGNDEGWSSAPIVAALALAIMLGAAFVLVEMRSDRPMLDPRQFARPSFSGTVAVAVLQSVAIYPVLLFVAVDLQVVHGFDPLAAGVRVLPVTLTYLVTAPIAATLLKRVPYRVSLCTGLVLVGAGLLLLRSGADSSDWTALLPGLLVFGAGSGCLSPSLAAAAIAALPGGREGVASGVGNTFRQAGIAVGVAVLGAVFAAAPADDAAAGQLLRGQRSDPAAIAAFVDGFRAALVAAALAAAIGALAALAVATGPSRGD
jgi:EmrB/QacA subfamily drug resistance transporter